MGTLAARHHLVYHPIHCGDNRPLGKEMNEGDLEDKAIGMARRDWEAHSVDHLVVGDLDADRPRLERGCPFYIKTIGFDFDPSRERFCESYNGEIRRLVELHGIPDWAPGSRCPTREKALLSFADARPFADFSPDGRRESALVSRVLRRRTSPPVAWTRIADSGLILLGGDISPKASRVDILDLVTDQ